MAIKWVQCRVCGHTMHINGFPEPDHGRLKRTGEGTCKKCNGYSYRDKLFSTNITDFYKFIEKCEESA
jgi:hypothetical protein